MRETLELRRARFRLKGSGSKGEAEGSGLKFSYSEKTRPRFGLVKAEIKKNSVILFSGL